MKHPWMSCLHLLLAHDGAVSAAFKMKISWDGGVVIMRENAP